MALSILCRNTIIPLSLVFAVTLARTFGLWLPMGVAAIGALLLRGMTAYWVAALHITVRVFIVSGDQRARDSAMAAAVATGFPLGNR